MKKKILAYGLSLLMMTSLSPATIYAVGSDAQDVYSYEKISSILNDEGQFVMYSVKPANEMQAMLFFQENMTFWKSIQIIDLKTLMRILQPVIFHISI